MEEIEILGQNKGQFFKYFKITFMHLFLPKTGYNLDEIPLRNRSNRRHGFTQGLQQTHKQT